MSFKNQASEIFSDKVEEKRMEEQERRRAEDKRSNGASPVRTVFERETPPQERSRSELKKKDCDSCTSSSSGSEDGQEEDLWRMAPPGRRLRSAARKMKTRKKRVEQERLRKGKRKESSKESGETSGKDSDRSKGSGVEKDKEMKEGGALNVKTDVVINVERMELGELKLGKWKPDAMNEGDGKDDPKKYYLKEKKKGADENNEEEIMEVDYDNLNKELGNVRELKDEGNGEENIKGMNDRIKEMFDNIEEKMINICGSVMERVCGSVNLNDARERAQPGAGRTAPAPEKSYALIVKGDKEKLTSMEIKRRIEESVGEEMTVKVKGMRLMKDGGVVVEAATDEDRQPLAQCPLRDAGLRTTAPRWFDPRVYDRLRSSLVGDRRQPL
ncbi:hypothetical protein TSAR_012353 [Trichomalopsis sarcophagae]|uniref:DUF4780 domain-containing protein n=1 Tax=Trichomalopsis sarcophagae TaxID=543379 RepID=A0A232F3K4_9HYME|nr:hypothetical protein TSAR_012353 [Trichomalopsis sarcophagae]